MRKQRDFDSSPKFEHMGKKRHGRQWMPKNTRACRTPESRRVEYGHVEMCKEAAGRFWDYAYSPVLEKAERRARLEDVFATLARISRLAGAINHPILLAQVRQVRQAARLALDGIWEGGARAGETRAARAAQILELARSHPNAIVSQETALFLVRKQMPYALFDLAQCVSKDTRKLIRNELECMGRDDIAAKLAEGVSRDDLIAAFGAGAPDVVDRNV